MKNKKVTVKFFTISQYQQEEEYLSSMHEKGWKLTRVTFPGIYHFEKCEPGKVSYRLDYNQEGLKNKAEYIQMFSDCGWDYLFDMAGYSYFRKEGDVDQESEEIFCDDASRLDMMRRVFKGRILPLIITFMFCILPQFFLNAPKYGGGNMVLDVLIITLLLSAVLYLAMFGRMAYWFYQYEKKVLPEERSVKYKYYGIFVSILLIVICIGMFLYFSRRSVYSVSESPDGFTIVAEQLNTRIVKEYDLKEGDILAVTHVYVGGEIFISIGEENKTPVFYGNSYGEMGDFTVGIPEDGRYMIECSGRRARGVIRFVIN